MLLDWGDPVCIMDIYFMSASTEEMAIQLRAEFILAA